MDENLTAMILAAGIGKRLRPITNQIPKALIEINGKSMILRHLEMLEQVGFEKVIVNLFHLGDKIEEALHKNSPKNLEIIFSKESLLLETAGGIANALPNINTNYFAVINSDILTDYNFINLKNKILEFREKDDLLGHLILVENPPYHKHGDFSIAENLVSNHAKCSLTFSGISVFNRKMFDTIRPRTACPLAPILKEAVSKQLISGDLHSGFWADIGTPERLAALRNKLEENNNNLFTE